MAGIWISAIGALVGSTVAVLVARASVGTCLGCLAGVFLVLVDDGSLLRSQAAVSLLFGALIAVGVAFSWHQVGGDGQSCSNLVAGLFRSRKNVLDKSCKSGGVGSAYPLPVPFPRRLNFSRRGSGARCGAEGWHPPPKVDRFSEFDYILRSQRLCQSWWVLETCHRELFFVVDVSGRFPRPFGCAAIDFFSKVGLVQGGLPSLRLLRHLACVRACVCCVGREVACGFPFGWCVEGRLR